MASMNGVRVVLAAVAVAAASLLAPGCTSDETKLEQYRTEALQEREAGNDREAMILLRQALALAPKDAKINLELARTLADLGRPGDAAFYYGEAYRLDPDLSEAALARAPLLYDSDPDEARELIEQVIERDPGRAVAHVRKAEMLLLEDDLDGALTAALTALELGPDDVLTHRMLGTVYQAMILARTRKGEQAEDALYGKAIDALERARELATQPWQDLLSMALVHAAWPGHAQESRKLFEQAFEAARAQESERGMRRIATEAVRRAVASGDREYMQWALERRIEVDPDRLRAWQQLAGVADAQEKGAGEAVWEQAVEQRPDDPRIHVGYASYLGARGRVADAMAYLESLPAEVAASPEIDLLRVKVYAGEGRLDEARSVLARMRELHGNDPLTSFAAARIAMAEGRLDDASALMRSVAEELDRPDLYRLLAQLEAARGDLRSALAAAEQALATNAAPDASLYRMRNRLLAAREDWEGLLRSLGQMRREGPGWATPERIQLVHAQYQLGRTNRARALLDRLLEDEPTPAAIRTFVRYEAGEQPERARDLLRKAIERHPKNPALAGTLAQLELANDRPEAALESLAHFGDPEQLPPPLRLIRARAYARLDRWPEAEAEARAAFEAERRPPMAAGILASTLRAQDRLDAAVAILEDARSERSLSGEDLWLLGRMHLDRGDLEQARVVLEEAVGAAPELYEARNDLAFVLAETGEDLDRAMDLARQAKAALPENAAVADTLGRLYFRRGLLEPALSEFRSAISLADADDDAQLRADLHYHLAQTLQQLGRTDEARSAVEQALEIQPEHEAARAMRERLVAASTNAAGG